MTEADFTDATSHGFTPPQLYSTASYLEKNLTGIQLGLNNLAGWAEGDWNGDGIFTSDDFVIEFQDGGYEQGPRTDVAAVPEPGAWTLLVIGLVLWLFGRRTCAT